MCEATAIIGAASAVAQYQEGVAAAKTENRAKLKNFERDNKQYLTNAMLADAKYKNDVSLADIKQDNLMIALSDQWAQNDADLDRIFAQEDFKIEKAIREMFENDYAGTQTGRTAARVAMKSTKELGYQRQESIRNKILKRKETYLKDDAAVNKAKWDSYEIYETARYAPIHGHAPVPPNMTPKPSPAGMILGIASSVAGMEMFE